MAELEGAEVDPFLLDQLSSSEGRERLALVETAGRRGITEAMPQLLEFMTSKDSDLRNVAIDALALTVGADELPPMIDRLIAADVPESAEPLKDALQKACQRMADREAAADVITNRMPNASPRTRAELLDLLIYVGGPRALEAIGTAARSDDTALGRLRDAGARQMAHARCGARTVGTRQERQGRIPSPLPAWLHSRDPSIRTEDE